MSRYKVYSYQVQIVQAMTGGSIGQGVGSEVLYKKERDPHYTYPSVFGNHRPIFYNLSNITWFNGQSNDIYWSKHRRINRDYTYPNYFGAEAWYLQLSNVPFCISQSSNKTEYWLLNRRINKEYLYPSFFMNIKRIPTSQWVCDTVSTDNSWTCDVLSEND